MHAVVDVDVVAVVGVDGHAVVVGVDAAGDRFGHLLDAALLGEPGLGVARATVARGVEP